MSILLLEDGVNNAIFTYVQISLLHPLHAGFLL